MQNIDGHLIPSLWVDILIGGGNKYIEMFRDYCPNCNVLFQGVMKNNSVICPKCGAKIQPRGSISSFASK
jgi:hypothetical protein